MMENEDGSLNREIHCFSSSYAEYPCRSPCLNAGASVSEESREESGDDEPTREQITKDAIIHGILHALDCIDKMGGSLNNFGGL